MLIGLTIKDVVLIEALDLEVGAGLTVLTGETGAGKSIILDALGLALGRRADTGLVRRGANQAQSSALFALPGDHPVWSFLGERGFEADPGDSLVLRRQLTTDGRSRGFVNDQPVSVAVMRELGALLIEVHGQHETVGLLDPRTHRPLLDEFAAVAPLLKSVAGAWGLLVEARERRQTLTARSNESAMEAEERAARLAELDRLDPKAGEEASLGAERALLGAAEKALADIAVARDALGGEQLSNRLAQAFRALERARERTTQAGASEDHQVLQKLTAAAEAVDRALIEGTEALALVDAAADAFEFEPDRLEKSEERLFALRAAARRLGVEVDALPAERVKLTKELQGFESVHLDLEEAERAVRAALLAYETGARALSAARRAGAERLELALVEELVPLKLEKARFKVAIDLSPLERAGPKGRDQVEFQISTNPGAPFGALGSIASGGELARFALALKAALAGRGEGFSPTMIFDEVDQGVGGAVADAVGLRLKRLAQTAQVILVTHSPQIAARAEAHWRVSKAVRGENAVTALAILSRGAREEEIARMLAGAEITDAARAAARALMHA